MKIAIDALNIRVGGGLTHLRELLTAIPICDRIPKVVVFCNKKTANKLPSFPWLSVYIPPSWSQSRLGVVIWRRIYLDRQLVHISPDVSFVPGGTYLGCFCPFVVMAQSLLPFEPVERARMGISMARFRFHILEQAQGMTFRRATRVIHMSNYARSIIDYRVRVDSNRTIVIYHGVNQRFLNLPPLPTPVVKIPPARFHWLYVSIIDAYKHQCMVAAAAGILLQQGLDLSLDFVGPGASSGVARLQSAIVLADPLGDRIKYLGPINYNSIERAYAGADGFVFASSCETFGLIVVEAMAVGLPIAASNRSSIPEIVGDAGVFFDPESPTSISDAMRRIMIDHDFRHKISINAKRRAAGFTWAKCAQETLAVLEVAVTEYRNN